MSPYASASATNTLVTLERCSAIRQGVLRDVDRSNAQLGGARVKSDGWVAASSASCAAGRNTSSANSSTVSMISFWSRHRASG